jgi:hypothetical protein
VSRLGDVGEADSWRCWLCDEPVDATMSVNDARGPSVDSGAATSGKGKSGAGKNVKGRPGTDLERLAHRACNTRKGAVTPVAPWPAHLFVVDPAPIIPTVERLQRKGGREIVARCPTVADGQLAAAWLVDRISRLSPGFAVTAEVEPGGGQFMLVLRA